MVGSVVHYLVGRPWHVFPESSCQYKTVWTFHARSWTYLMVFNAEVVPIVQVGIYTQWPHGTKDNLRCDVPIKRWSGQMNWEVCISEVLCLKRMSRNKKVVHAGVLEKHTWYTVPPPLLLRIQGMPVFREALKFTSFHGFWFLPMTTHGLSLYRRSSGSLGFLCRNNLDRCLMTWFKWVVAACLAYQSSKERLKYGFVELDT